jgi:hypothetical protein
MKPPFQQLDGSVVGGAPEPQPNLRVPMVTVAVVGCGSIAAKHARCFPHLDSVTVRALCDAVSKRQEDFLRTSGGSDARDDAAQTLRDGMRATVALWTAIDSLGTGLPQTIVI